MPVFQPTLPTEHADLMRVSDFQRRQQQAAADSGEGALGGTQLHSLSSSLMQDLMRFDTGPQKSLELLEVLAAAIRHSRALRVHLQHGFQVVPLTVFPLPRRVHTPMPLAQLLALRLRELRVLQVQAERRPPTEVPGDSGSLGVLLWELALRGSRESLLPEIAGSAAYRIAPGSNFDELGLTGTLAAAVSRLHQSAVPLREIAAWPGFDEDRALRLLNALYLHAALIVSRSTPGATQGG